MWSDKVIELKWALIIALIGVFAPRFMLIGVELPLPQPGTFAMVDIPIIGVVATLTLLYWRYEKNKQP